MTIFLANAFILAALCAFYFYKKMRDERRASRFMADVCDELKSIIVHGMSPMQINDLVQARVEYNGQAEREKRKADEAWEVVEEVQFLLQHIPDDVLAEAEKKLEERKQKGRGSLWVDMKITNPEPLKTEAPKTETQAQP